MRINKFLAEKGITSRRHADEMISARRVKINGIVATLGVFPELPYFPCAEFHDSDKISSYTERFPIISEKPHVVSSDAHYLWDISGRLNCFELDVEEETPENIRKKLFERLKGL